ncbi:fatty acyl-coa reductase [Plakobranchus ocellatus]|uniref:Fatty acyl-CoA reductase n=1 Tax=Plakobranchus ocellatus TaxID=259542 RepID=A0AAV4C4L6_9GAST|nr:fatty acyl-coa reductase [Plakobranchus ocellatus]
MSECQNRAEKTATSAPSNTLQVDRKSSFTLNSEADSDESKSRSTTSNTKNEAVQDIEQTSLNPPLAADSNCNNNNVHSHSGFNTAVTLSSTKAELTASEAAITDMPASALELGEGASNDASERVNGEESRSYPPVFLTNGHHPEHVRKQDAEHGSITPAAVSAGRDTTDNNTVQSRRISSLPSPSSPPCFGPSAPRPSSSTLPQQEHQRCASPASPHHLAAASPSPRHRTRTISATSGEVSVPMFFTGKSVLVTGATGFIGKVLIEKLLRCCPDLACVYCLIRPKNNQEISARLEEITSSKVSHMTH